MLDSSPWISSRRPSRLFLLPLCALWLWALSWGIAWREEEQAIRLKTESHVVETLDFYLRSKSPPPLEMVLETLRQRAGLTSLQVCAQGRLLTAVGEGSSSCATGPGESGRSGSAWVLERWRHVLPGNYEIRAETRLMSLKSSLLMMFLALPLLFLAGSLVQAWSFRSKAPRQIERSA